MLDRWVHATMAPWFALQEAVFARENPASTWLLQGFVKISIMTLDQSNRAILSNHSPENNERSGWLCEEESALAHAKNGHRSVIFPKTPA